MNALITQILSNFLAGKFQPQMQMFNQMMNGKTPEEQMQTILNMAKSKGININQKMFSETDLREFGLTIPRKG